MGLQRLDFVEAEEAPPSRSVKSYRALFLSDMHLGSRSCQANRILNFLRHHEASAIYLVGDIVDFWALQDTHYWPQEHNDVIQKLLRQARKGVAIYYIPGNHDEFVRGYIRYAFGGIEIVPHAVHVSATGKRYLVTHGDQYDFVVGRAQLVARIGGYAYDLAVAANRQLTRIRRSLGLPYWSLAQWLKLKVKDAVAYIGDYEQALVEEARTHGAEGVICGHIHHAVIHDRYGLHYINCGDWVEDCTAVGERADGSFEIIDWSEDRHVLRATITTESGG